MAGIHAVFYGRRFSAMVATGGTINDYADADGVSWRCHTFNANDVFSVTELGTLGGYVQRLLVGGGGGGGLRVGVAGACGGGGAGEHRGGENWANADSYEYAAMGANAVTVGLGGALATNGGNSVFLGLSALGGGHGGQYDGALAINSFGADGGSGGGAGQPPEHTSSLGGTATAYGNRGGNCAIPNRKETSGGAGGGGAGGPGEDSYGAISPFNGGNGGPGKSSSITGTPVMRAAGGGGAGCNRSSDSGTGNGAPGIGGSGIGGNGAAWEFGPAGTVPAANTGSGGGGSVGNSAPGFVGSAGAAGVVCVRYPLSAYNPPHLV